MKHYKIAFVGLGSIGTRHLRNVHTYTAQHGDKCSIDCYRSSINRPLAEELAPLISNIYRYSDELPDDRQYDIVFVTNPTAMHYETISKFACHTRSFFIEKPVFDKTEINLRLFDRLKGIDCYVACPLRYNQVLQYVKNNIDPNEVISARAISSSYLPDWRPGQDYRKCYSAHRDMGGGVSIDLIHEWDYLTWLFGMPIENHHYINKVSQLEIDSDDIALYIARTPQTTLEIHLDYFGRKSIRTLEIFTHEDTIQCNLIDGLVQYLKSGHTIKLESERNSFQLMEINHFFDIINHNISSDSTPEHAYRVLKLAKGEQL